GKHEAGRDAQEFGQRVELPGRVVRINNGEREVGEVFQDDRAGNAGGASGRVVDEGEVEVAGMDGVGGGRDSEILRPDPRVHGLNAEGGEAVGVGEVDEATRDQGHDAGRHRAACD